MICQYCQEWMEPVVDQQRETMACSRCNQPQQHRFVPLFMVTGPSGSGKTAIIPALQRLLPDWHIFETDILWDSGGSWDMVLQNWLRIADSIAQRPDSCPTILCGTWLPERLHATPLAIHFRSIHWLALTCEPAILRQRLEQRPAWRGWNEATIAEQLAFARWFTTNAAIAFDPPLVLLDTSSTSIGETAVQIRDWALLHWRGL